MTPEKIHLALNHFVVVGLVLAMVPLAVSVVTRSYPALLSGLLVMVLSAGATPFIMGSGEGAFERYEAGEVREHLDAAVEPILREHEERGHFWSKVLYGVLGLSALGLVLSARDRRWHRRVALVCLLGCLVGAASAVWVAESGGEIRRPDFRGEREASG